MDTALRVFSFVGLGMGGKSSGKEFPVLRQSRDKRTGLEEAPRRRNISRGPYRATELSLLYEEDHLIEDGDREEKATPHDGHPSWGVAFCY